MKTKLSIFAITFIFSLALLSCVHAGDVNETVIADDQSFIESNVVYEDEIAEVSLSSPGNEITPEEENPVPDIVIDNNNTTSFEIVSNAEYSESDFVSKNYETPDTGFFNDGQFFDINLEFDEKYGADFNNNFSITPFVEFNISLDDVASFEVFMIKMEDFDSSLLKEGKFKNSFAAEHELMFYVFHDNNFKNYLNFNIIVCSNKVSDKFAYSINNSIMGDESRLDHLFNSSYQNYLFLNNSYFSCFYIFCY